MLHKKFVTDGPSIRMRKADLRNKKEGMREVTSRHSIPRRMSTVDIRRGIVGTYVV